ncbi:MAG: hypothetical protein AAB575_05600 [Patescibacteria group bacterium]
MKKLAILFLAILLLAPAIVGAGSDTLKLNQQGQLSAEQLDELAGFFNRQFLWVGFCTLFFLVLFCSAIVILWKKRGMKNLKLKIFIVFQLIVLAGLVTSGVILTTKHYTNKETIKQGVTINFGRGKLEKYYVKSGRYNESGKFIYKINGEKYHVLPDDLLKKIANNELIEFYYIELLDTETLKLTARQKLIVNSQVFYGE